MQEHRRRRAVRDKQTRGESDGRRGSSNTKGERAKGRLRRQREKKKGQDWNKKRRETLERNKNKFKI